MFEELEHVFVAGMFCWFIAACVKARTLESVFVSLLLFVKIWGTEKVFDSLLLPVLRLKTMKSVFGDLLVSTRVYLDTL